MSEVTKQTLKSLLAVIDPIEIYGSVDIAVTGLACDSRRVEGGDLFFALPGVNVDGFRYLPQALAAGAAAVIAEKLPEQREDGVCYIRVAGARRAMALIASQF
jgi:UDP-N-acetylmuramoyl-L-alanyl-D-glutamate--2,6-diaminopimelate ligase